MSEQPGVREQPGVSGRPGVCEPRDLVVACVGDSSLHPGWLEPRRFRRAFDLMVIYFGEVPDRYREGAEHYVARKDTKYALLSSVFAERQDLLAPYAAIWLPDDDLRADSATIARMFRLFHEEELALAQPALTRDSYFSHDVTLRRRLRTLRYTNFVEVMAPLFRRDVLLALQHTFTATRSGWGLDFWWCKLVRDGGLGPIAVLDATAVTHTRPIDVRGGFYRAMGIDPCAELRALKAKHGLTLEPRELGSRWCWQRRRRRAHPGNPPAGAPAGAPTDNARRA